MDKLLFKSTPDSSSAKLILASAASLVIFDILTYVTNADGSLILKNIWKSDHVVPFFLQCFYSITSEVSSLNALLAGDHT